MSYILAIETSCDETSAAVVDDQKFVLSNVVASQVEFHRKFGGVVPEIASRKHLENINFVVGEALEKAGLTFKDIDYYAATNGPGLIGALLIGMTTAKSYAFVYDRPLVFVDHVESHIWANFLNGNEPELPAVAYVISGGHTSLYLMNEKKEIEVIGSTLDDAVGEAFDKVAKILGLPYPGGPEIEKLAEKSKNPVSFPRPAIDSPDLNFSFSGLKTAVLYFYRKNPDREISDIARGFQDAVIDVLISKARRALEEMGLKSLIIAGGVIANKALRHAFMRFAEEEGVNLSFPQFEYCTDNAAMIGARAADAILQGQMGNYSTAAYAISRYR